MPRLAIGLAALVLAAAVASVLVLSRSSTPAADSADAYRGSEPPGGLRLPSFSLAEASGARFGSNDLSGKVAVVTFLETKCEEACPIIGEQIREGLARLDARERARTVAVAISTHPVDDTPANVREFLRVHRVQGTLHYLIGSEPELRPVWRAFAVLPAFDTGDANIHSAPVRIFAPDGAWVSTLNSGADLTPANLAHDVGLALRAAG
jgi:cytochrome oxidase Cu insertion factor (SCO1/SenC/PrrC family)